MASLAARAFLASALVRSVERIPEVARFVADLLSPQPSSPAAGGGDALFTGGGGGAVWILRSCGAVQFLESTCGPARLD